MSRSYPRAQPRKWLPAVKAVEKIKGIFAPVIFGKEGKNYFYIAEGDIPVAYQRMEDAKYSISSEPRHVAGLGYIYLSIIDVAKVDPHRLTLYIFIGRSTNEIFSHMYYSKETAEYDGAMWNSKRKEGKEEVYVLGLTIV